MRVVEKLGELTAGAEVHICWRIVRPGNPFLSSGPFEASAIAELVSAPWGTGDLSGAQLFCAFEARVPGAIREVRIRAERPGAEPGGSSTSLTSVERGEGEFYSEFVVRTDDGALRAFLDIELE